MKKSFNKSKSPQNHCPTQRALDGWDSAPFSGFFYTRTESCSRSFIHARPPASNANRWAPGHKTILKIFNGMSVSYAINYTTRSNSRNLKSV